MKRMYLVPALLCAMVSFSGCGGGSGSNSDTERLSVVAISRHGILSTTEDLNQ
jgi:hypothetical protein